MKRVAMVVGLALGAACGLFEGDDEEGGASWTAMEGAPVAVSGLTFDSGGRAVAVAGSSTFGTYYLQRPRPGDGLWERAEGVRDGRFGDPVLRVGGKVYAVLNLQVFRLDDEANFTWTSIGNPVADTDGDSIQFMAVSADDVVYATSTRRVQVDGQTQFQNVVLAWWPGQSDWAVVPGAEIQSGVWAALVDGAGELVYSTGDGLYRGDPSGVSKILDCQSPDYNYCESQISALVSDAAGNLTFAVCPFLGTHRALYRIPAGGGEAAMVAKIPDDYAFCKGLEALPDGHVFLFAAVDNLTDAEAVLYRLAPGASTLAPVTALDSDYRHVVRDGSTVFRFGDGHFAHGIDYRKF
jgi:hypothetical protein